MRRLYGILIDAALYLLQKLTQTSLRIVFWLHGADRDGLRHAMVGGCVELWDKHGRTEEWRQTCLRRLSEDRVLWPGPDKDKFHAECVELFERRMKWKAGQ